MSRKLDALSTKISRIVSQLDKQGQAAIAASGLAAGNDYCDFFVENGGDGKPWHEKCPQEFGILVRPAEFSRERVTRIDTLGLRPSASDGYCDFFVENGGDGKPWHEKCPDVSNIGELVGDPTRRAILISRTNVMQTLQRAMMTLSAPN